MTGLTAPQPFQLWTFVHIVGVAGFLFAHGVSGLVAFRLRKERDRTRIETLMQLSGASVPLMYVSLVVLIVGGVVTGLILHSFGQGWIWAAIGLLVAISVVMWTVNAPYYGHVKDAVKLRPSGVPRVSDEELDELLMASAPMVSAGFGFVALAAIIYLMVVKPF